MGGILAGFMLKKKKNMILLPFRGHGEGLPDKKRAGGIGSQNCGKQIMPTTPSSNTRRNKPKVATAGQWDLDLPVLRVPS